MPITYDLRAPTFVVVGRWNDAILNEPGWIAKHLLGAPEGAQLEIRLAIRAVEGGQQQRVFVFDDFAIGCGPTRLELYMLNEDNVAPLYSIMEKVCEVLPHTPISGLGTNFRVFSDEGIPNLSDNALTAENFDDLGITDRIERTETFKLRRELQVPGSNHAFRSCVLKLQRITDFQTAMIDFNFHYEVQGIGDFAGFTELNLISHWWEVAKRQLANYGVDEWTEQVF